MIKIIRGGREPVHPNFCDRRNLEESVGESSKDWGGRVGFRRNLELSEGGRVSRSLFPKTRRPRKGFREGYWRGGSIGLVQSKGDRLVSEAGQKGGDLKALIQKGNTGVTDLPLAWG